MTVAAIEDKYSYYSRVFNIICKHQGTHPLDPNIKFYRLEVMVGEDLTDLVTDITIENLNNELINLKNKTYANL